MDCIFGEGILPGSTISIEAPGGVGKTSLCLTLAQALYEKLGYKQENDYFVYNLKV